MNSIPDITNTIRDIINCIRDIWKWIHDIVKLNIDMYISWIPITHITNSGLNSKTAFHMRSVQQTLLQFVNAVQLRLMHSLLDVTPYLAIDRVEVGAIRRPQIWRNESGCWLFKKSNISRARCALSFVMSCVWQLQNKRKYDHGDGCAVLLKGE